MEFKVRQNTFSCGLWFIGRTQDDGQDEYVWKDLTVYENTGYFDNATKAPGYYATKAEAERYLMAYEVSQMKFTVKQNWFGSECHGLWYVSDGDNHYIHKDLEVRGGTGSLSLGRKAPGYHVNELSANITLARFKEKYSVPQTTEIKDMKFIVRQCRHWPERGWYIITDTGAKYHGERFVWRDLELHEGTGYGDFYPGTAPGYYCTQTQAEIVLRQFKEKHSMTHTIIPSKKDNIEINVKSNGKPLPLHKLSVESLLAMREASKPKPVPVFQVCGFVFKGELEPRLVLKVTPGIAKKVGRYVLLDETGCCVADFNNMEHIDNQYRSRRELRLDEV